MYHLILLLLAIVTEVAGTIFMRYFAENSPLLGTLIMLVLIGLSYLLLSKAIQKIPLGIAYALWEGCGLLFITLLSYYLFDELLSLTKVLGIGLIILGLIYINFDEGHGHE